jgi:hypothetical protein
MRIRETKRKEKGYYCHKRETLFHRLQIHWTNVLVRAHGEPWNSRFREKYHDRIGHSTFTEPQAIVNSLCRLFSPSTPTRVRVVTDNTVARASFERSFNKNSYHINYCVKYLNEVFGTNLNVDFVYMAGVWNFADSWSRGRTKDFDKGEGEYVSAELRRLWGMVECPRELRLPCFCAPSNSK